MDTKKCTKCGEVKPLDNDNFGSDRGKWRSRCKACDQEYKKEYRKIHSRKHEVLQDRYRKQDVKRQVLEELGATSCTRCPENYLACLDFHHEGNDKEDNISQMIRRTAPYEAILAEAKKCIVLCANCHRKEHNPPLPPRPEWDVRQNELESKLTKEHVTACIQQGWTLRAIYKDIKISSHTLYHRMREWGITKEGILTR